MDSIWVLALAYPAVIAALFYFAFLRPVQQEQKKRRKQLATLRVGDEVLTQAGFQRTGATSCGWKDSGVEAVARN